jgi:hypothetical protein
MGKKVLIDRVVSVVVLVAIACLAIWIAAPIALEIDTEQVHPAFDFLVMPLVALSIASGLLAFTAALGMGPRLLITRERTQTGLLGPLRWRWA